MIRYWIALPLLALSVGAQADWQGVQWGMSPEAVIAAGGSEIVAVDEIKDKRIQDNHRLATSRAVIDDVGYVLDYFFKPKSRELVLVSHVPAKTDCDVAIASHNRRFGDGKPDVKSTVIQPGKPPLVTTKFVWRDPASGDLIEGANVAVTEYRIRYCQFLHSK
jgi:hypothetical protein